MHRRSWEATGIAVPSLPGFEPRAARVPGMGRLRAGLGRRRATGSPTRLQGACPASRAGCCCLPRRLRRCRAGRPMEDGLGPGRPAPVPMTVLSSDALDLPAGLRPARAPAGRRGRSMAGAGGLQAGRQRRFQPVLRRRRSGTPGRDCRCRSTAGAGRRQGGLASGSQPGSQGQGRSSGRLPIRCGCCRAGPMVSVSDLAEAVAASVSTAGRQAGMGRFCASGWRRGAEIIAGSRRVEAGRSGACVPDGRRHGEQDGGRRCRF